MKSKLLTIGELSKKTGCSIKALRYYDLIGLLKPVYVDPNSNYRYYNFEQTRMVELIQICINLSIPLKEVKDLVFKDNNKIGHPGGTLFPVIFCQPVFTDEFEGNYILRIPETTGKE